MEDIECVFESMSGRGSIFISNYAAALNLQLLSSLGIRAILSVARSGFLSHSRVDIPFYLFLPAQDHEEYPIQQYFDQSYEFMERARRETNVLVHCMAGISRSATIVAAYLLRKYKYTLAQVLSMIQRKRKKICPNKGFIRQLKDLSLKHGIKCDFTASELIPPKETNSKMSRAFTAKKQKTMPKREEPLSPITRKESQITQKKILEDLWIYRKDLMNQEQKLGVSERKPTQSVKGEIQENEEDCDLPQDTIDSPLLKRSCSVEPGVVRKRSSIEEKLSKIRERIIKTEKNILKPYPNIHLQNKENSRIAQRSPRKERFLPTTLLSSSQLPLEQLEKTGVRTKFERFKYTAELLDSESIFDTDFNIHSGLGRPLVRGGARLNSRLRGDHDA